MFQILDCAKLSCFQFQILNWQTVFSVIYCQATSPGCPHVEISLHSPSFDLVERYNAFGSKEVASSPAWKKVKITSSPVQKLPKVFIIIFKSGVSATSDTLFVEHRRYGSRMSLAK